ncbi:unnamed protein product, partial [Laminaria digitata]
MRSYHPRSKESKNLEVFRLCGGVFYLGKLSYYRKTKRRNLRRTSLPVTTIPGWESSCLRTVRALLLLFVRAVLHHHTSLTFLNCLGGGEALLTVGVCCFGEVIWEYR